MHTQIMNLEIHGTTGTPPCQILMDEAKGIRMIGIMMATLADIEAGFVVAEEATSEVRPSAIAMSLCGNG